MEPERGERLRFADIEIDCAAYEIRKAGALCAVEPQVFDLILYLARRPDQLVTKDDLIAGVWGGRIVSDAALSSRIKSARRVLGDDGQQQRFIRTVHGRGIRFVGEVEPAPAQRRDGRAALVGDLRQEIRFCTSADGTRIAYASVGSGPVLVKAGNWLTHLDYDWESPVWRHWIRDLAADFTLIRYDQRGNGLSDWDAADLSLDAQLGDLKAVLDAVGQARVALLGVSQGCAIGAAFAARYPDRISRLALYGGYARGWARRGDQATLAKRQALLTLIAHGWGQDNPAFRQIFSTLFMPGGSPDQIQWYNELQRRTASPANARRISEAFGGLDIRDLLAEIQAPALILHARGDQAVPFAEGRLLAAGIPGAHFVPLEGDNHLLLEDEPAWPRFLGELRSFLSATAG